MSFGEFFQAFGSLGDAYREGADRAQQKSALAALGTQLQSGDYAGAAKTAFDAGDVGTGMNLLKLGQDRQNQASNGVALNSLIGGLYGGGASPATGEVSSSAPVTSKAKLPTFAQGSNVGAYGDAIAGIESGGRYDIVGPTHPKYGQALGRYQVMESNLPSWSQEALGRTISKQEFLANPQIQDAIFQKKFGQSVEKYGNPQDAASVWFTGRPLAQGAKSRDSLGTTGQKYVDMFTANLGKAGGPPMGQAPALPVTAMQMPGSASPQMADAGPMQMPGVIANAPLPPQRPVQLASADPDNLPLPTSAAPQMAPPAPRQRLQAPLPSAGGQAPMQMPPQAAGTATPVPAQTGSLPSAPSVSVTTPAPTGDDDDGVPAAAAPSAPVAPQVRAQVSAQAPQHLADAGLPRQVSAPVGATQPASQQRIQALLRASMLPGLSEGQSKVVSTLLTNELEQTKLPESVKQYIFAKSPQGGGFDGTFADFQNKKGDEGAKISAQLQARQDYAIKQGMDPQDPGVQSWIMSGKTVGGRVLKPGDILTGASGKELARNAGSAATSMPDQTADLLAERVLAGDTKALIGLGRGAQGAENLSKIQGLVAQKAQERGLDASDILRNAAEAQGMGAQARTLGTQAGRMSAAATEAEGAIELARTASASVPRGSFVPLNRLSQAVQSNTGDPSLKAFNAANNTLVNTFARAISPSGVGTVADKEHAREMLSTADSPQAYEAVLRQMQAEIDMAHKAPQRARDILERERQGAKRGASAAEPTMVPNPVAPTPAQPAPQAAPGVPKPAAADRFGQLVGSGLNKAQAYQRLREEGY